MKQNKFIKITLLYKQILEEIKVLYDHCKMVENMELFEKKCITKNESLYCENLVWFCKSVTKRCLVTDAKKKLIDGVRIKGAMVNARDIVNN